MKFYQDTEGDYWIRVGEHALCIGADKEEYDLLSPPYNWKDFDEMEERFGLELIQAAGG